MKIMKLNIFTILFLLLFSSCDDFLEEKPKDRIIPQSVQDYDELFYGEAYMRNEPLVADYLDLMTDDVKCVVTNSTSSWGADDRENGYGYFAWQIDPELAISGARNNDKAWEWFYHSILMCNMTLNDLPGVSGAEDDKEDLMAEAHFMRAWDYFMLVNIYGEPYNESTASTDLGVPFNDVTGMEDKKFERSSVAFIYDSIEKDLEASIALFLSSNKEKDHFRANLSAAYLLASRVALYKKNYKKAIELSNLGLAGKSTLYDLQSSSEDSFINYKNPEILFSYGNYYVQFNILGYRSISYFPISDELASLFEANDLREKIFFDDNMPNKSEQSTKTGIFGFAMRTAELYLNRAEAYAEKGEIDNAMKDVNELRKYRLSSNDITLSASTKEEAIQIVRDERRKELCFERHRWFDLRRWGRPSLTHIFIKDKKNNVVETYVLEKEDSAYTLSLPYAVILHNKEIKNIDRPERNPQ